MLHSRFSLCRSTSVALIGLLCAGFASSAHAQVSLVGALLTSVAADGSDISNGTYQYTTNNNIGYGTLALTFGGVTYDKGIALALTSGSNAFTFTDGGLSPGSYAGIELFFADTATSYNPATSAEGRPADLYAVRDTASSDPFFFPVNGIQLADYSSASGTLPYGGASSFVIGGFAVTVSDFAVDTSAQGNFTLNVSPASTTATPEPGSIAMLVGIGVTGAGFLARRKRRK